MTDNQNKMPLSLKLGFVTGPLFIILGAILMNTDKMKAQPSNWPIFIIAIGVVRTVMSFYLYRKQKKTFEMKRKEMEEGEKG
jgi:uncharacterized membrane protein SirB2